MLEVENETVVAASTTATWAAITRFKDYPQWHPYVRIEGLAELDGVVTYSFLGGPGRPRRWTIDGKITTLAAERRLTIRFGWRRLGFQETYAIHPLPNGVRIVHGISFDGVLALLAFPAIKRNLAKLLSFEDRRLAQHIVKKKSKPSAARKRN